MTSVLRSLSFYWLRQAMSGSANGDGGPNNTGVEKIEESSLDDTNMNNNVDDEPSVPTTPLPR